MRLGAAALLAAAAVGLGGCLDGGLASSVAFPPDIPGLVPDQPWVRMPVDAWVADGPVEAVALAACFSQSCAPQAAVGLFRARGREGERLARIADDPERLARAVLAGRPRPRGAAARPRPPVAASAERIREAGWRGFSLHLGRRDGSRGAHAAVLTRQAGGTVTVVMVVSPAPDGALRIAREIAAGQG